MRFLLRDSAVRVAVLFALLGGLWVLLSDYLLIRWTPDHEAISHLETTKEAAFVLVVAVFLFLERKRSDRRLMHLAAIVESSDDAIIGADHDGRITHWNRGAEDLYGYPAAEIMGREISILYPPDRGDELKRFLDIYRTGESVYHHETVRLRKDGRTIDVSLTTSPLRDSAGRHLGTATITRDITDRKRAEEAAKMAEVGTLASGIAHEVRNPLNAMRMQLAVIRDMVEPSSPESAEEIIQEIDCVEHEMLRVQNLANDFLAYGRPAAARLEEIRVAEFVRDLAQFLRPEFQEEGIEVVVDPGDEVTVCADRGKLRQILINLAANARQAMREGGGRLTFGWKKAPDDAVRLEVRDTGCGISPEHLPCIFDAFYSTREEGTGMGLAIVRRIVEAAGGRIEVRSVVGEGTVMRLLMPRVCRSYYELEGMTAGQRS
jgi:PAS domain S-box-containing protein